jgi:hypothetical protein
MALPALGVWVMGRAVSHIVHEAAPDRSALELGLPLSSCTARIGPVAIRCSSLFIVARLHPTLGGVYPGRRDASGA